MEGDHSDASSQQVDIDGLEKVGDDHYHHSSIELFVSVLIIL
jgi:hypothetical protein